MASDEAAATLPSSPADPLPVSVVPDAPPLPAPPPPPKWQATQPAGRKVQFARYQAACQEMAKRHERHRGKVPSKRTDPTRLVISPTNPDAALGVVARYRCPPVPGTACPLRE